jgi:hypothetical protein
MVYVDASGKQYLPPQPAQTNASPTISTRTRQFVDQKTRSTYTDGQNSLKAYENAVNSGDPNANTTLFVDMKQKAATFQYWLQEELRIDKFSGGQSAVNNEISKINANFNGDDDGRGILQKITDSATGNVQGESTAQSTNEIKVNVQVVTQGVKTALQNHQAGTQVQQDYLQSLQTLQDDLVKEMNLPANDTDMQLSDTLAKLKAAHQGESIDALIVDIGTELKVGGHLSKINPDDRNLSPAAKKLAWTDPVSLAFIQEIDPPLQLTASGKVPWFGLGSIPRFVPPTPALTAS